MFCGEGYSVLVVFLYFVVKNIEFCVVYVLLNLLNFNLVRFRYKKIRKNNEIFFSLGLCRGSNPCWGRGRDGEKFFSPNGNGAGTGAGGVSGDKDGDYDSRI